MICIELMQQFHYKLDTATFITSSIFSKIDKVMQSQIDLPLSIETVTGSSPVVEEIDFSDFVPDLIQDTFEAIVDATIQQIDAYAPLLEIVTNSMDKFTADNIGDTSAKVFLTEAVGFDFVKWPDSSSNY